MPFGREAILNAFAFREAERLPIDFGATRSSSINALAYAALRNHLATTGRVSPTHPAIETAGAGHDPSLVRVFDVRQYLALVEPEIAGWAGSSVLPLYPLRPAAGLRTDSFKVGSMPGLERCLVPLDYEPIQRDDGSAELLRADGTPAYRRAAGGLYFEDVNPRYASVESPQTYCNTIPRLCRVSHNCSR